MEDRSPLLGLLDLELTERCNNDCIHCCINLSGNDVQAWSRELSTSEIIAILKEAAALGALSVRFTGGEPLLRDELTLFKRPAVGAQGDAVYQRPPDHPGPGQPFCPDAPFRKDRGHRLRHETGILRSRIPGAGLLRGVRPRGRAAPRPEEVPFVVKGAVLPPNRKEMEEFEAWAATLPAMKDPPRYAMFFDLPGPQSFYRQKLPYPKPPGVP